MGHNISRNYVDEDPHLIHNLRDGSLSPSARKSAESIEIDGSQRSNRKDHRIPFFPEPSNFFTAQMELMTSNDLERRIFIQFMKGELWRGFLQPTILQKLMDANLNWIQRNDSIGKSAQLLSTNALRVREEEIHLDRLAQMAGEGLSTLSTPQQQFSLTIACILPCFLQVRRFLGFETDEIGESSHTMNIFLRGLHLQTQEINAEEPELLLGKPASSFPSHFTDPQEILSSIVRSADEEDFDQLIHSGEWLPEVISLLEEMPLALSIILRNVKEAAPLISEKSLSIGTTNEMDSFDSEQQGSSPSGLVYANNSYHSWQRHVTNSLQVPFSEVSKRDELRSIAVKSTIVIRGAMDISENIFIATLPIPSRKASNFEYLVTLQHSLSGQHVDRAILQLTDLLLLTTGSLLL